MIFSKLDCLKLDENEQNKQICSPNLFGLQVLISSPIAKRLKQMANLRYTLTTSAPSRAKGVLCAVVGYKGSSSGRKPFTIDGLISPDFRYWDKKAMRFTDGTDTARLNNPRLDEVCALCNELLENSQVTTPEQFITALKNGVAPKDMLTLGGFVNLVADEMRGGTNNKYPSRTYQNYRNLLHKLEREGELINLPIADIANVHFIQFSNFLLSLDDDKGKSNYLNLMKLFKQVHTKAYNRELNDNALRFRYTDYAPLSDDVEKRPSLTLEQFHKFCELDLTAIPQSGVNPNFYKALYRDFCVFLYETKTRPADVIRSHSDNIVTLNGRKYLKYIPEKKKNSKERNKVVTAPLSERALQIIERYKGQSSQGYIFPFSMNEYKWDFKNADSWNNWNNRKQRACEMVNQWLKKVQTALGVAFPLTLYTFRHSALTHACMADGANYMKIALDGGTSPDMLLKHYVSNVI